VEPDTTLMAGEERVANDTAKTSVRASCSPCSGLPIAGKNVKVKYQKGCKCRYSSRKDLVIC
jgi:hypothetical protein